MHAAPPTIGLDLDDLHHRVAAEGVESNWTAVAAVMAASRAHPAVLGVLADPTEPEVVRQRAYTRAVAGTAGAARARPGAETTQSGESGTGRPAAVCTA